VTRTRRFVHENGLGLFFGTIFLLALLGQALSGRAQYNHEQAVNGLHSLTLWRYVTSSSFAVDVAENWQSEYLQFLLYIFATVWLMQRGSPESKQPDKLGPESDADQHVGDHARSSSPRWAADQGWRGLLYSRSLGLVMGLIFVLSWLAQSVAGTSAYNEQQLRDLEGPVSWWGYVTSADFWSRTLQNWQSEFLAVGSMAVFAIYLRQRGSPESKPVGAAHGDTGATG
jgi:hypothetical protein